MTMEAQETKSSRTQVQVFIMQPGWEVANMIVQQKGVRAAVRIPKVGILYPGAALPEWLAEVHDTPKQGNGATSKLEQSAVLTIGYKYKQFVVALGQGRQMIDPSALQRKAGLKVALAMMDPHSLKARINPVEYVDWVEAELANAPAGEFGDIQSVWFVDGSDMIKGMAGKPCMGYRALFGDNVHGEEGLKFMANKNLDDIVSCVRTMHKLHKLMSRVETSEYLLLLKDKGKGDTKVRRDAQPALPKTMMLLPHLLRILVASGEPLQANDLYRPVAEAMGTPVKRLIYGRKEKNKTAYQATVRFALQVLQEMGLVGRDEAGWHTVTKKGKAIVARNIELDQKLVNKMYQEQMREDGELKRLNWRRSRRR